MEIINAYIASPLGFSEAGRYFYNGRLLPLISEVGFTPLDPWVLTDQRHIDRAIAAAEGIQRRRRWEKANQIIAANNEAAIRRSRLVVAILDGTDVDSGTAAEVGLAYGLNIPIIGYRGDFRLCADNAGAKINLQVEYFITRLGGEISTSLDNLTPQLQKWHTKLSAALL